MKERTPYIKNPLTIIGIFALLTEAISAIVLGHLNETQKSVFLCFIIFFPIYLVFMFFRTLTKFPQCLYTPSDYQDENNWVKTITQMSPSEIADKYSKIEEQNNLPEAPIACTSPSMISEPDARIKSKERANEMALIEEKVIAEIEKEYQITFNRFMRVEIGAERYQFDALLTLPDDVVAVDVCRVKRLDFFPLSRFYPVAANFRYFVNSIRPIPPKSTLIIAIVHNETATETEVERAKQRLTSLSKITEVNIKITFFAAEDILRSVEEN